MLSRRGMDLKPRSKSPFEAAWNGIKDILNKVITGADAVISGLNHMPFVNIPLIPHLAVGTKDFAGGMAMVGERGPELVYLPQHAQVVPNNQLKDHAATGAAAANNGPKQHITINGYNLSDPARTAAEIGWKMRVM